ncbi:ATP synthase F0 subunit C [Parvularcula marina]|uniref:ATP synthase subunit c n=1 Tax=Parvularcula marina TaxID=2292771 RepID=A0A371RHF7_9PROT|nr:ATP synthase F0 subunit C [Parvularcula marina]RFB04884.1 ATP synthase F0 subunit C [Parvularcula marina]
MEAEAAKLIGAGLAVLPLAGVGIGLGILFGNFLSGAFRNPSAKAGLTSDFYIAFALTEATGLFGLVVSLLILFVF